MKTMAMAGLVLLGLVLAGCDPTGSKAIFNTGNSQQTVETAAQDASASTSAASADTATAARVKRQSDSTEQTARIRVQQPQASSPENTAPKTFKDFRTGLAIAYAQPWYIAKTEMLGPIFAKNGKSYMTVAFHILTTDSKKARQRGYSEIVAYSVADGLRMLFESVSLIKSQPKPQPKDPADVAITKQAFPYLEIQWRYRGNDGRSIIHECRDKNIDQDVIVYHIFEEDKVASFAMYFNGDRQLLAEMEKIALSVHKP